MATTTDNRARQVHEHTARERSTHAQTLAEMFHRSARRVADPATGFPGAEAPALRWKERDRWIDLPYRDLGARAERIARGLIALGIERGDRIAILSNTRPEWTIADAGVMCAGAATAPVYHTNSPDECEYVLAHSESRLVFCEDPDQLAKVAQVRERCPQLEHTVLLTGEAAGALTLEQLCAHGDDVDPAAVDERVASVRPSDPATLVYTSGTTGPPKACMLSHANWMETAGLYEQVLDLETPPVVVFMFLPLAHSLARIVQMLTIDVGGTLVYWQRDAQRLLDDIRETSPTHLTSVPRVFEKIFTAASAGVADAPGFKRRLFDWALTTGREVRDRAPDAVNWRLRLRHAVADRLVLAKVRGLFGTRLRLAMSGAAPIAPEVLRFFDACGVTILEGWGLSESTAAGAINTVREHRIGTVGRALPGVGLRIADDGEILMRGPHIFDGYLKNPEATGEALVDGWLQTGDTGSLQDGFLTITGRKKDLIITSSGKNISPANIETALKESRWISEALVYGDNRPYLVALITLDPEELPALAAEAGVALDADHASVAADPRVRDTIGKAVDEVNGRFARIEQVKRFEILPSDFTQGGGELTPTLKVKRRVVHERYADLLDRLYA